MSNVERASEFARVARVLAQQRTIEDTLQAIVDYAVCTVDGAQHAGITVQRRNQTYQTVAATGELARQVDEIQYEADQGPCLSALTEGHVFRSDDLIIATTSS